MESPSTLRASTVPWKPIRIVLYVAAAILLFIFALDMMASSVQQLGTETVKTIVRATSNPFAGLFIGMLVTAMMQSSSTTTAIALTMVISGSLTLENSIPIIMGANIGTTITSLLVSLGFVNKKKEFRRAISAGSFHFFFNVLTAILLFPLEYYYRFLSSLSESITKILTSPSSGAVESGSPFILSPLVWLSDQVVSFISNEVVSILISFVLLLTSILLFRKLISDLLKANSPEKFSRFFFVNRFKSFLWGLLTTAAIRSSTITTSVVVPIVAKKITTLQRAAPFIMGANVGTTITVFIAALLASNSPQGLKLAMVHFLFNTIGVILFFPIPYLRDLPLYCAQWLGNVTQKNRFAGFAFILVMFFILPFALIYLNQEPS